MHISLYPIGGNEVNSAINEIGHYSSWGSSRKWLDNYELGKPLNYDEIFGILDKSPFQCFEKVIESNRSVYSWKRSANNETYSLEFEVPRFRKENIKLTVENGVLHLSAEQNNLKSYQSVSLPKDADVTTLSSYLDHGVLYVETRIKESAKPVQIAIGDAPKALEAGTGGGSTSQVGG